MEVSKLLLLPQNTVKKKSQKNPQSTVFIQENEYISPNYCNSLLNSKVLQKEPKREKILLKYNARTDGLS